MEAVRSANIYANLQFEINEVKRTGACNNFVQHVQIRQCRRACARFYNAKMPSIASYFFSLIRFLQRCNLRQAGMIDLFGN